MISFKTVSEIHDAYDAKKISPSELTRNFLAASKATTTNAYITICEERALAQAKAADDELAKQGRVPRSERGRAGRARGCA